MIRNGVVHMFQTPGSFSAAQDSAQVPRFMGVEALDLNQVVALAVRTVERLVRSATNPIASIEPKVFREGEVEYRLDGTPNEFKGKIPFYMVSWPTQARSTSFTRTASIEIDARKGSITRLALHGDCFFDTAFWLDVSNRVSSRPAQARPAGACRRSLPTPTTNRGRRGTPRRNRRQPPPGVLRQLLQLLGKGLVVAIPLQGQGEATQLQLAAVDQPPGILHALRRARMANSTTFRSMPPKPYVRANSMISL